MRHAKDAFRILSFLIKNLNLCLHLCQDILLSILSSIVVCFAVLENIGLRFSKNEI